LIAGAQIRAARALLNWTAADAAERIGAVRQTILRLEQTDGIPPSRSQTLFDLKRAFEEAGVEFIGTPEEPGVILRRR
jgi:DNA-binding XRE family transcriptional regulator